MFNNYKTIKIAPVRILLIALLITLLTQIVPLHAASFDCTKATTETEIAICNDPELSALDELMSVFYKLGINQFGGNSLKNDQVQWLKGRDDNFANSEKDLYFSMSKRTHQISHYSLGMHYDEVLSNLKLFENIEVHYKSPAKHIQVKNPKIVILLKTKQQEDFHSLMLFNSDKRLTNVKLGETGVYSLCKDKFILASTLRTFLRITACDNEYYSHFLEPKCINEVELHKNLQKRNQNDLKIILPYIQDCVDSFDLALSSTSEFVKKIPLCDCWGDEWWSENNTEDIINEVVKYPNARSGDAVPLRYAVLYRNPKIVKALILAGADVNSTDRYGNTILSLVSDPETAKLLIKAGGDVNDAKNIFRNSPLHKVARVNCGGIAIDKCLMERKSSLPETIKILLESGADPNMLDRLGKKPLYYADKNSLIDKKSEGYLDLKRLTID